MEERNANREEISIFEVGSTLLENRWRIARWAFAGAIVALVLGSLPRRTWTATASFVPERSTSRTGGLESLAGELGVNVPGESPMQSPQFFATLLNTHVILSAVAGDSADISVGGAKQPIGNLISGKPMQNVAEREEAIEALRKQVSTSVDRTTGVVTVAAKTRWPLLSRAICDRLIARVNDFNLRARKSHASNERRYIADRLTVARRELEQSEGQLSSFLRSNRHFSNSPELTFQYDHLQREVALRQQVLVGLSQSYEEASSREIGDLPQVTVIEPPSLPAKPDPRGRARWMLLGFFFAAALASVSAVVRELLSKRNAVGDEVVVRFTTHLRAAQRDVVRWLPHVGAR